MKTFFSLLLTSCILCGCSSTHQINSPEDAKKRLNDKSGATLLAGDLTYQADGLHVLGDSLAFTDAATKRPAMIALRDITVVKRTLHGRGVLQGGLIGMGGTLALIGTISILNTNKHVQEESGSAGAIERLVITGATLVGGVLGAMGGGMVGSHETYIFNRDSLIGAANGDSVTVRNEPVLPARK